MHRSKQITNSEAYELLITKLQDHVDNIIVRRSIDHLSTLELCPPDVAVKVVEELEKIGFSREAAVILVNVLPKDSAEARALLAPLEPRKTLEDYQEALRLLASCREEARKD